jgi:hypothetical protein
VPEPTNSLRNATRTDLEHALQLENLRRGPWIQSGAFSR